MNALIGGIYPWIKALHVIAVISWLAALLYLPRLFVYHVEDASRGGRSHDLLSTMEVRLLRIIATPAMVLSWLLGLLLLSIPDLIDWTRYWPWMKLAGIGLLTWFHFFLAARRKEIEAGTCRLSGRTFRFLNEIPTLGMILIVIAVIVRPF